MRTRMTEEAIQKFKCLRCGNCCRRHGIVRLSETEVRQIADFLSMEVYGFTNEYTELLPDRSALTLTEFENGDCIFFREDSGCMINSVKPKQCRDFPFYWRFDNWENECAGAKELYCKNQRINI